MVNEELLQFIREQEAAGMARNEIEQLLVSEGGWDRADVDEAYRTLTPRSTPPDAVPPLRPADTREPVPPAETVFRDSRNIAALWPGPSGSVQPSAPAQKNAPAQIDLDKILSGATSGRISVQTNVSHNEFPGSPFAKSGANTPLTPDTSQEKKTPAVSLPAENRPPANAQPLSSSSNAPQSRTASPLKFSLDALRKNVSGDQKTLPPPLPPKEVSPSKIAAVPPPQVSADDIKEKAKSFYSSPSSVASLAQEINKKTAPKTRTMISDLLLREKIAPAPGTAPVSQSNEIPADLYGKKEDKEKGMTVSPSPSPGAPITVPPFEDDAVHHARIKRMITTALLGILAVLLLGGGIFAYMKYRTPDPGALLNTALTQFYANSSLTYKGKAAADLTLSAASGGIVQNGAMKFSINSEGILANGANGYGDGEHHIGLLGGWQWGDSLLSTDLSADVRSIGDTLYMHVLSFPAKSDLDPEFFKDNWLEVQFSDLRKELRISGVTGGDAEEYGSFAGTSEGTSFNALFQRTAPLKVAGDPTKEMLGDTAAMHIRIVADREGMAAFAQALYRKYSNKDLILSEDQLLRFKDALAKISGDVWINADTGTLEKIILSAKFDDDIAGIRVQGPSSLEFSFVGAGQPVAVDIPEFALTLPDLRVQMNEFQMTKEMRSRDQMKIGHMLILEEALENYHREAGRYPKGLPDLYAGGKLATSTIDLISLNDYFYRSYQKSVVSAKSAQCLASGKTCAFYHLGVNLEEAGNSMLKSDADLTTAIFGADSAGCGKEVDRACYDVVSPDPVPAPPVTP